MSDQIPCFTILEGETPPSSSSCIHFKQGFALDFPGRQRHSVLDETSNFAFSFNEEGLITCLEVLRRPQEMPQREVERSCLPEKKGLLRIENREDLTDQNFSILTTYDEKNQLCEIRFSRIKPLIAFHYAPSIIEIGERGQLSRIVIDLSGNCWEYV